MFLWQQGDNQVRWVKNVLTRHFSDFGHIEFFLFSLRKDDSAYFCMFEILIALLIFGQDQIKIRFI